MNEEFKKDHISKQKDTMEMNKKVKVILFAIIALVTVLLVTSCVDELNYAKLDQSGYQVSVKYDANGGNFTAGTTVMFDSYNISSLPTVDGNKVAKLIKPGDKIRGSANENLVPSKPGYEFVGWYTERTEIPGENGETTYVYSGQWDFDNDRLKIDPNKEYTSREPALTLYAAWIPQFKFEFYSIDNPNKVLKTYEVSVGAEIELPEWDEKTGNIKMHQFPTIDGKTFLAAYTDPEGKNLITTETIKHYGEIDKETVIATNSVMKIYIDTMDGEWKHIYTVEQLKKMNLNGNYILQKDLDLQDKTRNWEASFVTGKFTGKLIGKVKENGEPVKIKNLRFYQESGPGVYSVGMFGQIGDGAVIENIAFENVTMELDVGSPLRAGVTYGLLSGTISDRAKLNNVTISGTINIDTKCTFSADDYVIRLVAGTGNVPNIDYSNIKCVAVGDNADKLIIKIDEDRVIIDKSLLPKS